MFFALQDGGTTSYIGLGYKVIHFKTWVPEIKKIVKYYYICPLGTTYEEALDKVIEKMRDNNEI